MYRKKLHGHSNASILSKNSCEYNMSSPLYPNGLMLDDPMLDYLV